MFVSFLFDLSWEVGMFVSFLMDSSFDYYLVIIVVLVAVSVFFLV